MASDSVTLADAMVNVELLDDFQLSDSQPALEAHCAPLDYRVNFGTNFEDRNAFITGNAKYIEEATRHGEFSEMLVEGFQHAGNLYTWRCCSRAVPMAKSNDQPNRIEINKTVVTVLIPEVDKLYRFMTFSNKAIGRFCDEIKRLCHPEKRKDFVSEAYLLTLGKFMNMFAVLDELKNMKASIKNDFSTFRRAAQSLQSQQDVKLQPSETIQYMHDLSMFLATHNKIRESLKSELQNIEGYEEILADVVNICVYLFENHMYISPDERHMFVKVLAFSLYLMDGQEKAFVNKLDQKKRISIASLDKIFKSLEVVPLYGDMQIQPFSFVRKSAHFDHTKWPLSNVESERCHVNIVEKVKSIRHHHAEYVTHLSRINNEAVVYEVEGPRSDHENRELTEVTLSGIQLLCAWTSDVVETISWKLLHPTNTRENHECPDTAEEYERATRYNYNTAEKAALIEVISMIKGLHKLLKRMDADFTQAIRKHIYAELQDFVRNTLREPLQKAMKGKKDVLTQVMQSICDTCVDNRSGLYNPRSSDLISKNKKKKAEAASSMADARFEARNVPPSTTQLYMARTMLESLISERERGTGRRIVRKEIDPKHSKKMVEFLRMSYHWPALLNFSRTLEQSCELSQLWFREFYLEMTMGKRIQFPIEMSMPWILIDYILTSEDPALTECVLYQLDLYNDAAMYSLTKFKKQFLYDEVEAEVNLCFDQFVYKLSETVFTYYKQLSASMLMDKQFKSECTQLGITIRTPACARFESLLKQRHIQLLGRSIDLNRLVGQRLNIAILRSLDVAISKFESEPLTSIVELEKLIQANRLCHRLLSQHIGSLADFDDLFTEANHNVSAPYGRIALHAFWEINYDFIPHYSYNGSTHRFVRSKVHYREQPNREKAPSSGLAYLWGSKSLNAAFTNIFALYTGFIGSPHLKALARMLGYQGIAVIVEELIKLSNHIINGPMKSHAVKIMNLMPKVCKMPFYDYGSPAVLEYYLHHLKGVLGYSELKRDFFQVLREFGNVILFCMQLELALGHEEISDLLCAAPFTNVIPRPQAKTTDEQDQKMKRLEQKYQRIQIASMIEQIGNGSQATIAREGELLTKERLCCGLNIFENILQKLREMLHDSPHNPIWNGPYPDNGVMCIDECNQFHRLWSAVQFAICDTLNSDQPRITNGSGSEVIPLVEEVFGDSVHWAGCVIIMLLGQHRRFEVLDFCYHILRVHRADGKDGMAEGRKLSRFVDRIRRVQLLNNQIFAVLNNYTQTFDAIDDRVRDFEPPVHRGY